MVAPSELQLPGRMVLNVPWLPYAAMVVELRDPGGWLHELSGIDVNHTETNLNPCVATDMEHLPATWAYHRRLLLTDFLSTK